MSPSPPHLAPAHGLEQITSDIKHMAAVRKEKRREKKKVSKEKKNGAFVNYLSSAFIFSVLSPFSIFVSFYLSAHS